MSHDSSNSTWLKRKLEDARRRVNQLEIDAYRIRTDLAQIEVANSTGVIGDDVTPHPDAAVATSTVEQPIDWQPAAETLPDGMEILVGAPMAAAAVTPEIAETLIGEQVPGGELSVVGLVRRPRRTYRRATSPFMTSLVVHVTVLILALSITVVGIERNNTEPMSTTLLLGDKHSKEAESFDPHQLADLGETGVPNAVADMPQLDAVASVDSVQIPVEFEPLASVAPAGKIGANAANDSETGKMPSGVAGFGKDGLGTGTGEDGGKRGGAGKSARSGSRLESTLFFGTEAKGTRFVFVVDNSSSMKGGRLELAVAELVRTVEGLSPRQSFYVIFVSDKTYPMFYPTPEPNLVPATPANKKRLVEWAPKAVLASGKNRELIKAMDLAASLQPQAVYLLWDGDMRYSETVRLDVMTHLTEPNQWNFIIHTLGMGSLTPNSEQNLRMISQAHRGTFRRIDVPASRTR